MGQERNVVTETMQQWKRKTEWPRLRAHFDYSQLDVDDWFFVRGKSLFGRTRRSLKTNPATNMFEFEFEQIEPLKWKITRTA